VQIEPTVELPVYIAPQSDSCAASQAGISDDHLASTASSAAADSDEVYVDDAADDSDEGGTGAAAAPVAATAAAAAPSVGFKRRGGGDARRRGPPKKKSAAALAKEAAKARDKAAAAAEKSVARAAVLRTLSAWSLTKEQQQHAEALCLRVIGPAGVAPASHLPFTRAGTLNPYLHLTLARTTGPYLFRCAGFEGEQLEMLLAICELLTSVASHSHTEASLMNLRLQAHRYGQLFGRIMPETEHTIVFHLLFHHVVELLEDWGPASHTWCFGPERYAHKRAPPAPPAPHGQHRQRVVRGSCTEIARRCSIHASCSLIVSWRNGSIVCFPCVVSVQNDRRPVPHDSQSQRSGGFPRQRLLPYGHDAHRLGRSQDSPRL
jgi:hypothetical protein